VMLIFPPVVVKEVRISTPNVPVPVDFLPAKRT
jgi:hypothetical protein